jgi:hypothetical protein
MNEQQILIIESTLLFSLVVFLVSFSAFYFYSSWRLGQRRKQLVEFFAERYEEMLEQSNLESQEDEFVEPVLAPQNHHQTAFRSLLLAGGIAVVAFLLFAFVPIPGVQNFVSDSAWKTAPLRLTVLEFDRFQEGFSLDGEVWNQTEDPLERITAVVTILDLDRDILDEVPVPVGPDPLEPGQAGTFSLRYTESSPFLYGYRILFKDAEDAVILHQEGFDVR